MQKNTACLREGRAGRRSPGFYALLFFCKLMDNPTATKPAQTHFIDSHNGIPMTDLTPTPKPPSTRRRTGTFLPAAKAAVNAMREDILAREVGAYLGSEEELMQRLGISRDTLRQATRLLENEGLLTVKRGVKGGFYGREPDINSVVQAAATFLRVRKAEARHTAAAGPSLWAEACRLAAASDDEALRGELVTLIKQLEAKESAPTSAAEFIKDENTFTNIVLQLSANPFIELFLKAMNRFGLMKASFRVIFEKDLMSTWRADRIRLGKAILLREPEFAELLAKRQMVTIGAAMLERADSQGLLDIKPAA